MARPMGRAGHMVRAGFGPISGGGANRKQWVSLGLVVYSPETRMAGTIAARLAPCGAARLAPCGAARLAPDWQHKVAPVRFPVYDRATARRGPGAALGHIKGR